MGTGLVAVFILAAAAARPDCPTQDEVVSRLRALAPAGTPDAWMTDEARVAVEDGRVVVDAPGRPSLRWDMPAGDCRARAEAAALVAARHLRSAPAWEPIAAADPAEWLEWSPPAPAAAPATETVTDPVAAPVAEPAPPARPDTRAEIPRSPALFNSTPFNDARAMGIGGLNPWNAWLAVLGWPDIATRPLTFWVLGTTRQFPRGPGDGGALRVESTANGFGWRPLLGVELGFSDGLSVPLLYGASYRDLHNVFGYTVDVEYSLQGLAEITAFAAGAPISLNLGANGEVRARWEIARGLVLWASIGARAALVRVGAHEPFSLSTLGGVGFSIDPSIFPWR